MDATVTVKRNSNFVAMFRAFTIIVDGKKVDKVKNGKECSFTVPVGRHEIEIKGALWAKSQIISFDAESGQSLRFECGINMKYVGPLIPLSILLFAGRHFGDGGKMDPIVALVFFVVMIAIVIFAFMVSLRRNWMYCLDRVN